MRRPATFLLLFLASMCVYFIGGYWTGISAHTRTVVKVILPVSLLLGTYLCSRTPTLHLLRYASLSLLAASFGFLVPWLLTNTLQNLLGLSPDTVPGIALLKLIDSMLIVGALLLVARAGGLTFSDLYLQTGKAKQWLTIGLSAFAVFLALFLLQTFARGMTSHQLLDLAPWTLLFIFANGFMEELHFRGLLLRPFGQLLGPHGSNLSIALMFTLVHAPVQYAPDILSFLTVLFVLALVWGYIIQKTEALWGSVLFHAGADLMIVVGIYETYSG